MTRLMQTQSTQKREQRSAELYLHIGCANSVDTIKGLPFANPEWEASPAK